jgi:polygalacturonase
MLTRQQFLKQAVAAAAVPLVPHRARAQAAPGRIVNVRDHGARGDGSTDDARAIATAIQAALALGAGATVALPAGRYLLRTVTQVRARPI